MARASAKANGRKAPEGAPGGLEASERMVAALLAMLEEDGVVAEAFGRVVSVLQEWDYNPLWVADRLEAALWEEGEVVFEVPLREVAAAFLRLAVTGSWTPMATGEVRELREVVMFEPEEHVVEFAQQVIPERDVLHGWRLALGQEREEAARADRIADSTRRLAEKVGIAGDAEHLERVRRVVRAAPWGVDAGEAARRGRAFLEGMQAVGISEEAVFEALRWQDREEIAQHARGFVERMAMAIEVLEKRVPRTKGRTAGTGLSGWAQVAWALGVVADACGGNRGRAERLVLRRLEGRPVWASFDDRPGGVVGPQQVTAAVRQIRRKVEDIEVGVYSMMLEGEEAFREAAGQVVQIDGEGGDWGD